MTKPITGTGEWAECTYNIQTGCEHRCAYCYASAMAIRFGRATAQTWGLPVVDSKRVNKAWRYRSGRIMFPSAHDITPMNVGDCSTSLSRILAAGNKVLIVSKPWAFSVLYLCRALSWAPKDSIEFRFTIGSADDAILKAWEPGSPSVDHRFHCLEAAIVRGYRASVSMEPMLDRYPGFVIDRARDAGASSVWLGRANRLTQIVAANRPGDAAAMDMARKLKADMDDSLSASCTPVTRTTRLFAGKTASSAWSGWRCKR